MTKARFIAQETARCVGARASVALAACLLLSGCRASKPSGSRTESAWVVLTPDLQGEGPLEPNVVADLRALGAAFARDSLRMFMSGTPGRIEALALAVQRGDRQVLKEKAHVLRGSCGMVGARRLSELCAQIEAGSTQTPEALATLLAAVRGEYRRVAAAIEAEIASLA